MWSKEIKELVIRWKKEGKSLSQISKLLNITKGSAQNLYRYNNIQCPRKRGPEFKLNDYDNLVLKREIGNLTQSGEKINALKLVRNCRLNISKWSVQRYMRRANYQYKNATHKIKLSKKMKIRRCDMVRHWISTNHHWNLTIFSDEKRFNLDGPDHWMSYMRKREDHIRQKRCCGGGSINIWMMVLPNGLLAFREIAGNLNSEKYIDLLSKCCIPITNLNMGNEFYLQQDNARPHTSIMVKKFFENSNIIVLEWPPYSPDLNITEDVWHMLSNLIYDRRQHQNKKELLESITWAVNEINQNHRDKILDLYNSIHSRMHTVLEKKGDIVNK